MKKTTWKQADVFPVIALVIRELHGKSLQPVTADEIAAGLLKRADGRSLVNAAHSLQVKQCTHEWLAGNMVAWFGIRMGKSDWVAVFEKTEVNGRCTYWPIDSPQRRQAR